MKKARKAYRKSANGRRTKKTVTAKRQARPVGSMLRTRNVKARKAAVPHFEIKPLRRHVVKLCREWRREERALDKAFDANDGKTMRVHERYMEKIEREMRRLLEAVDVFPWHAERA